MFKLKANPTFTREVGLRDLDGNVSPIKLIFAHMRRDDLNAFVSAVGEKTDGEVVHAIVRGWLEVDTEFSTAALDELMQEHEASAIRIWREYLGAYEDARAKN